MKMIETYYRILKHDPNGKLVKDTGFLPSHSYVIQFLELIYASWQATLVNATDVTGAESILQNTAGTRLSFGRYDAPINDDTYGIVVGTNAGASAVDNEDFALDTKIAHGAGAGQMNYLALTRVVPTVDAPNVDYDVSRVFANASGGPITVKEIGFIVKNIVNTKYHLILRDVVSDEVVANGFSLTVVYTLRTTV